MHFTALQPQLFRNKLLNRVQLHYSLLFPYMNVNENMDAMRTKIIAHANKFILESLQFRF